MKETEGKSQNSKIIKNNLKYCLETPKLLDQNFIISTDNMQ